MKSTTAREVTRHWSSTVGKLKPGETLEVTNRGKTQVNITRPAARRKIRLPDFQANARADGATGKVGAALFKRLMAAEDEVLS